MRARPLIALLAVAALAIAACTEDEEPEDTAQDAPEDTAEDIDPEDIDPEDIDPEELLGEEPQAPEPVDLEDGVAATVDGTQIPADVVEERYATIAELPQVAEQLEGEEGEQVEAMLQARIVQNLVLQQIVADGAEELGVEPSDEDVAAADQAAAEEFEGGPDAFEEALEEEGVTDEQREEEFRFLARMEAIGEELGSESADEEMDEVAEELGMGPEEIAFQGWLGERLGEVDAAVDEEYGIWNPATGEVVPAGLG